MTDPLVTPEDWEAAANRAATAFYKNWETMKDQQTEWGQKS